VERRLREQLSRGVTITLSCFLLTMSGPSKLPVVTVQPTFLEVIEEVRSGFVSSDTFWLSSYKSSEPSIHSKVRVTLDEVNRDVVHLEASGDIEIKDIGKDVSLNLTVEKIGRLVIL
jgi:hypothetical protein